ncbi:MAG: universal stress protein [Kofleriaceae bacterium]|nr:universal stress protein [Myxococcales bacterium]MCB9559274.1 universal stress protein [Kofleriaceae bacterium]
MSDTTPPEFDAEDTPVGDEVGHSPRVVLVAIDFSDPSRKALHWALELARVVPCHLHTVHVVDKRWRLSDLRADIDALRAEMVDVHDAAAAELAPLVDADARRWLGSLHEHVTVGDPAGEIIALGKEISADMIVVGSHGGDALERLLVGSVARKVVRDASCPVVVVKSA